MERVIVFLDFANIDSAARACGRMDDYHSLLTYLSEGRFLQEAFAYVPIDPRNEHGMDYRIERLWASGFMVLSKIGTVAGCSYKCNFDVEMTVDIMRLAHKARPDIMVLCTGDRDFLPVVHELRHIGIRVEVASFEHCISRNMASQASGFISLDSFMAEEDGAQLLADADQWSEADDGLPPFAGEPFQDPSADSGNGLNR